MATTRGPDPANLKVICLGLGRTGTTSLRVALDTLGFGPCYNMVVIMTEGGKDFPAWTKIGEGNAIPEDFDAILRGYSSALAYPMAMYPAELYAAYPDAKFILTTRDPAEWEKSMQSTILRVLDVTRGQTNRTELQKSLATWTETQNRYHRGRLATHTQQELLDHNERVKQSIPPEKLLVYEVGEGWDKLVEFLGVPKPAEPFPHLNDTATFQQVAKEKWGMQNVR